MGKLVAGTFVTLDGVMQAPGGPKEDPSGGFEHGGWSAGYWADDYDAMGQVITEQTRRGDVLLLGRTTYEIFAGHWPRMPADDPIAAKLNGMPKYVASNTLKRADWNNSTVVPGGRLVEEIARLKAQPDTEIQVTGSWGLLQTLIQADLVDRYTLWVFPVVLGKGKRLFGDGAAPAGLRLTGTRAFRSGVTILDYERDGKIKYGSFELDQ